MHMQVGRRLGSEAALPRATVSNLNGLQQELSSEEPLCLVKPQVQLEVSS